MVTVMFSVPKRPPLTGAEALYRPSVYPLCVGGGVGVGVCDGGLVVVGAPVGCDPPVGVGRPEVAGAPGPAGCVAAVGPPVPPVAGGPTGSPPTTTAPVPV